MTTGFREQWAAASADAMGRVHKVFANSATAAHESIVNGSVVTGAPPLPVDPNPDAKAGELKDSVELVFSSPTSARISTPVKYAPNVEDNLRGVSFRSGGPHGWKLTIAGFDRIVAVEAAKLGFR